MPLKNDKLPPVCVNHPDKPMSPIQSSGDYSVERHFHAIVEVTEMNNNYKWSSKATALSIFACKICGYCEFYLAPDELDIHQKEKDFSVDFDYKK